MNTALLKSTILIVDDNPTNLSVLHDYLISVGFSVFVAKNGERAVLQAEKILPDLILLDVLMPGIDGFETCRRLKTNNRVKDIPVIFMTALADTIDKVRGFQVGAVDYVTKPFQQEEVLARITAHLTIQHQNKLIQQLSEERLRELRLNISHSLPHELRTPLASILGYSEVLIRYDIASDVENVRRMAQGIYESAQRLSHLIENYHLYANLELISCDPAQIEEVRQQHIYNAESIITSVVTQIAHEKKRFADLVIDLDLIDIQIQITEDSLSKIIKELASNAFGYSPPGSPVKLKARIENSQLVVQIRNSGRGMSEDQINNIGAYMQFDRNQHEQQGSGLGLVIAKRLTELHKGRLELTSKLNDETIVTLTLNCRPE